MPWSELVCCMQFLTRTSEWQMDRAQRAHWTRIARDLRLPIEAVVAVHLDMPMATCKQRVMARASHKTLPATPQSLGIIERFSHTFEPPEQDEGFCAVLRVTPAFRPPVLNALMSSKQVLYSPPYE